MARFVGGITGAAPESISRLFPEEYAAGLDSMDAAESGTAVREARDELAATTPVLGGYAETVADPTAEEDFDAVLAALLASSVRVPRRARLWREVCAPRVGPTRKKPA